MMAGDYKRALAAFAGAVKMQPSLTEAKFNRGVAMLRSGDAAGAAAEFAAIEKLEKSSLRAPAAYHHALALDRMGKSKDAESRLDLAVALDPAFDAALLYSGVLRERRGAVDAAARNYLAYLERHPESVTAMLRLGVSAHRAGRTDVALPYLRKVIDKAPHSPEAVEARKFLVMWE